MPAFPHGVVKHSKMQQSTNVNVVCCFLWSLNYGFKMQKASISKKETFWGTRKTVNFLS